MMPDQRQYQRRQESERRRALWELPSLGQSQPAFGGR
jgi:hypothetical protein